MALWIVCFAATLVTLGAKFYFTRAIDRMRQNLARNQREALEMKGVLTDSRQSHQLAIRRCKEKAATIKRLRSEIIDMENKIKYLRHRKDEEGLPPARRRS